VGGGAGQKGRGKNRASGQEKRSAVWTSACTQVCTKAGQKEKLVKGDGDLFTLSEGNLITGGGKEQKGPP